jgi:hypothetical protein
MERAGIEPATFGLQSERKRSPWVAKSRGIRIVVPFCRSLGHVESPLVAHSRFQIISRLTGVAPARARDAQQ